MLGFLGKLIDSNDREIKKYQPVLDEINSFEKKIEKLTDKQLNEKFSEFKKRFDKGESLNELLPEAFAAVREATKRTLKIRHYDVQMVAAIALRQGKTLSATPALFLNAIAGKGVHLVTVNDYLAKRDAGWMGPIYEALGVRQ